MFDFRNCACFQAVFMNFIDERLSNILRNHQEVIFLIVIFKILIHFLSKYYSLLSHKQEGSERKSLKMVCHSDTASNT